MDWLIKKIFGDTLPDDAVIRWIFETYRWHFEYHGGFDAFIRDRYLVIPLNKNFPYDAEGHDRAEQLFRLTKKYAGMSDWPCILEPHRDNKHKQTEEINGDQWTVSAAGTFSMEWSGANARITYSPDQLNNLQALIATFAHELGHYYLANTPVDPPRGPKADEPATDLCAVYLGFGIFMANSAKEYAGGAVVSHKGYLNELTLSYALAVFAELHSLSPKDVRKHLRSNPSSYFESAVRDINTRWCPEMRTLRQTHAR